MPADDVLRLRSTLITATALAAVLAVPAAADARRPPRPVVTSVTPITTTVNSVLTIEGRNFRRGRNRNVVLFQRANARTVFAKVRTVATSRRLVVSVPVNVLPLLQEDAQGQPVPTRFRLRVLSRRLSRRATPARLSPLVLPSSPTGLPPKQEEPPAPDCDDDKTPDTQDPDDDGDLLPDDVERGIGTGVCAVDSDRDGMEDGWEYESALDLNSRALPFPGRRPYPNPLDGTDASADHDNDGLTTSEEHALWLKFGEHALPVNYSDGDQTTGGELAVPVGLDYLDFFVKDLDGDGDLDRDGFLSDEEKDADGDGLGNFDEQHFRFHPKNSPDREKYPLDYLERDTDGDGVLDGADDQDHDGFSNVREITEMSAGGNDGDGTTWHPLDPCKPDVRAPFCKRHELEG